MVEKEYDPAIRHQYILDLVRKAANVDLDDERVIAYQAAIESGEEDVQVPEHDQFGNNFFILFREYSREINNQPDEVSIYLNRAKEYGNKWEEFVGSNKDLLDNLLGAFASYVVYREIRNYRTDLVFSYKDDLVEELDGSVDHPFGLEGIGIATWDNINPLLEEVALKMDDHGIPSHRFFT